MTREEAEEALFDYEGIVAKGSMLGSAGMIVMDDTTDMVYQIWRLARFYAHESCAQCTQCREGTAWTTKILERILSGRGKQEDFQLLLDLSENMTGKTICVLSDSCAAPVVSGIQKFRAEFEAYIAGSRDPSMARCEIRCIFIHEDTRPSSGKEPQELRGKRMADDLVNVTIEGTTLAVPKGTTIIEAAKQAGILIPHYCYHPRCPRRPSAGCAWSRSRRRPS